MNSFPSCSLIISTYNWPEALEICLLSVLNQEIPPNEIIIADDGSKTDTKELIEHFRKKTSVPLIHVWHPDEGFQLAKIRNRAIAKSSCDYIIQIDGDIVLHPKFVHDHLKFATVGHFLAGSRMLLNKPLSQKIIKYKRSSVDLWEKGVRNRLNGIYFPWMTYLLSPIYGKGSRKYYVKGCNMSFWRKDLLAVNGYDENFVGWGREDDDIAIRLINNGTKKRFLKQQAIMCHLWHKEAARSEVELNERRRNESLFYKITRAEKGIDQYLHVSQPEMQYTVSL